MPHEETKRASPDALLARAGREGRGRLKIFLGAAPGVGKTYAMLTAARSEKAGGKDVAAGLIETHGRRETEQLVEDFEVLPRKPIVYRNQVMREFDLDAALARRPEILLVDEYAHTNVPGSRHPKRWQDIDELLRAGINVWTTLNIQHLESLNDVVQKISKVRVRETVPDKVFDNADEVILVDFPPDELLRRLAEGKVYVQDTAARAVDNFFKPQNLTALRELALRRAAERVDAALVESMQAQAIEGPWAAGERILACVGPDQISPSVVRAAKRLADLMDAPWMAVTVERPGAYADSATRRRLDDIMKLAESLGAETQTLTGTDLPAELLRFAKFENVTQIVVGRAPGGFFSELLRRSLPHELVRRTRDIAIHLVTREADGTVKPVPSSRRWISETFNWQHFIYAALTVGGAVGAGEILTRLTPIPNLSIVFLLAVLFIAMNFGIWPAVFASLLSFLAYNFFFISPVHTLTVAEPYELLALLIFLVVAIASAAMAARVREQARVSADRVRATRRLYEFTRRLSGLASPEDVAEGAASEIHISLRRPVVVLLARNDDIVLTAAWPPEDDLDAAAMTAARWAYNHGEAAGTNTGTLPIIPWLFTPLKIGDKVLGTIGVATAKDTPSLDSEERALLDTLCEQAAAALERASLAGEMVDAKTATEAERVRNTLLASISHDFRTPLSSILGAATSLLDYDDKLDAASKNDLLGQIKEEAEGLDEMVRNLLAMTRIDAGALELRSDWIDLREVAARVVNAARRRGALQTFAIELPAELPLVRADAILIEQAIGNIVTNAVLHTPHQARIVIDAETGASEVRLRFTDDGPGIAPDILPRIFGRFVKGEALKSASADGGQGTGLGLAIAKGIMEAHHGTIVAESPVAHGHGTRFTMVFPQKELAA
ncbi:osmosensitive potassium channel histidine kinase KdpD [Bradyrhizobiaceae bacterium SG-6C]|nr:osmosensitive potassium channel histidine kinase KdpD [Bradyrhizobiaceae bacterium SG-6C]